MPARISVFTLWSYGNQKPPITELIARGDATQRCNNLSGAEMPFPASTGPPSYGMKAQI